MKLITDIKLKSSYFKSWNQWILHQFDFLITPGFHYLSLWVYSCSVVDEDLGNIDFILLGSQVERSQARLKTNSYRRYHQNISSIHEFNDEQEAVLD